MPEFMVLDKRDTAYETADWFLREADSALEVAESIFGPFIATTWHEKTRGLNVFNTTLDVEVGWVYEYNS